MRLYEFQAKRILAEYGIPVPIGMLLTSPEDLLSLALPAVLKAQVPVGGRGKAGGIRVARDRVQAASAVSELLGADILGHCVQAILAEEMAGILREIYLAVLFDKRTNQVMVMASAAGGVEIEQVAKGSPEKIVTKHLHPFLGLPQFAIRYVADAIGIQNVREFGSVLQRMVDLFWEYDATLVEINPLAETESGLIALDTKMVLDDKAAYRHADLFTTLKDEQKRLGQVEKGLAERLAEEYDITYILLDGEVGVIADGAGSGMLALDLIQDAGGRAANFCEMGGLSNAQVMSRAIEVVLANPRVRALLITLIGGMTRMDEMADGIVQYLEQHEMPVPMVIRMCGTQEAVGKATLKGAGIDAFDDLAAAARAVVDLAGAG